MLRLHILTFLNSNQWRLEMTTAIANVGMRTMGFHTQAASIFGLASLAKTVSALAIPTISMYALSNIPVADARHHGNGGGRSEDGFVQCMNLCDKNGKDAHEAAKLLCYAGCLVMNWFSKKEK